MPEAEIAKAVKLLDLMIEFFGDDGHWTRGCYDDGNGGHHQSLGYRTPQQIYQEGLWICGRSAVPTGCASPASSSLLETHLPASDLEDIASLDTGFLKDKAILLPFPRLREQGESIGSSAKVISLDQKRKRD